LTADHGEIMDPRHDCWHSGFRSRCFHNHGKTLFDEELHVPLVFWLPGRIPAGETLKTPVSLLDLAPTILGLGDIRASESHDGRDLSKSIQEGVEPEEVPIFAQARLASAVRWGGYKYILHDRRDTLEFDRDTLYNRRRSYEELYALGEDPGELQNLANMSSPPADVLEALRARLGAVTETQREGEAGNSASWDATALLEMTAEELRALEAVEEVADEQTAVEPARWGRLVFHAGNPMVRFSGVIESAAEFQGFELLGTAPENRCHLEGSRRIRVDVGPTSELAGIRFRTSVPEAPLSFNIEQDGRVVGASHFYVGAYGLRLFDDPRRVSPWELAELSGAPAEGPRVVSSIRSGVFYWQEAQSGSVGESRLERPDELDTEVRGMMREWGYTGQ
jgi:hypothetical protein